MNADSRTILTEHDKVDAWLRTPVVDTLQMQKPLSDGALKIVARNEKEHGRHPEMATPERQLL